MKRLISRSLTLLLALSLLLPLTPMLLSSCSPDESLVDTPPATDPALTVTTAPETKSPYDENGFLLDDLPNDLHYGEKEVVISTWEESIKRVLIEAETGDIVDDAVYRRNRTVEDRLDVKLSFPTIKGNWGNRMAYASAITAEVLSNSGSYDIVASYNAIAPTLVTNGICRNLNNIDYLDLTKPWWSASMLEEMAIDGKFYLCAGDAAYDLMRQMYIIFFNKKLLEDYNLDDPYELVLSGKWTMEKLEQMTADVYDDLNHDNMVGEGDRFGFTVPTNVWISPFISSFDLHITEKGDDGYPVMAFGTNDVIDAVERLCSFFADNNSVQILNRKNFTAGNGLFAGDGLYYTTTLRDADSFDYGVLPYPKWDEAQESYRTFLGNEHTLFSIPIDCKDPSMSGAVLECFASEGYRQITPAYFETALKVKYSSDEVAAQIYDLLKENIDFNFGVMFGNNFSKLTYAVFREAVANNQPNWASTYAMYEKIYTADLEKIVNAIKALS